MLQKLLKKLTETVARKPIGGPSAASTASGKKKKGEPEADEGGAASKTGSTSRKVVVFLSSCDGVEVSDPLTLLIHLSDGSLKPCLGLQRTSSMT